MRKPLPEIPFPNDLAARVDASSPTGLRVNASLVAPSQLERNVRAQLDALDGFGTFAPITVAFDADLDVLDLFNRQNNADPNDDAVYLIDLVTGQRMPLDFGGGHFPLTLNDPNQYFLNDPFAGPPETAAYNLEFPTSGPFANFLHPDQPHPGVRAQADDLMTFYERSTRTLILRPVVPLAQERRYAVVLTNRLHDASGRAIVSPHSGINHASQTTELQPLLQHLPAGVQLSDVAYAWAFTTQTITHELEDIRDGLAGRGPYAILSQRFPIQIGTTGLGNQSGYQTLINVLQERGAFDPANPSKNVADYVLPVAQLEQLLSDPQILSALNFSTAEIQALEDTFKYVDYFVSGSFVSPSFINVPGAAPQDQSFQLDPSQGAARAINETVYFTLAVPKANVAAGHLQPFPTVIAGHGYKSTRIEHILGFAGTFAKFGLATISIDAYGHGLAVDPTQELFARQKADQYGLAAFADALFKGRARDLDNDGIADSGGDFWTADTFHTRDVVRQSIVDWIQLVSILRTFDGVGGMVVGGGALLAGDFDNDGIPDVAGPVFWPQDVTAPGTQTVVFPKGSPNAGADLFVFGVSLGGILGAILPAVEPNIAAAAPASTAGGLADVGLRSTLSDVVQAVWLEVLGPFFANCRFSASSGDVDPQTGLPVGACNPGASDAQDMLVMVVQDVSHVRELPVAPLTLAAGDRLMVTNLAQAPADADCSTGRTVDGCAIAAADSNGLVRLPFSADWPQLSATSTSNGAGVAPTVTVTVSKPGDPLRVTVLPQSGATRVIDAWGVDARFYGVKYPRGTQLSAPARGFGYRRNSPDLRRLLGLSQLILDPGDPVNYAPHYANDLLAARSGDVDQVGRVAGPANVLVVGTAGDPGVPINTAISLARAAGLVELNQPDPAFGMSIDQVLIRAGVVEGVPGTRRFDDPAGGVYAALPGHVRCDGCAAGDVLVDPSGYACDANGANCTDGLDAPRLSPPLRQQLVRTTAAPAACPINPRAQQGVGCYSTGASSCATSAGGLSAPGLSALLLPYMNRTGQHGFRNPQPQKPFDMDQYLANLIGRYFECRGRELHFEPCQQGLAACPWMQQPPQ